MNNASFILRRAITEPTTVSPPLLLQKKDNLRDQLS